MSEVKILVASIINFLRQQLEGSTLNADSRESLEVGIQCLESAFEITDTSPAPQTVDLLKLVKEQVSKETISPDVKAYAEQLKNEGNNLMKSEKYKEALEQYTKAIQLDSRNAVFYCNRAAAYFKLNNHEAAVADCMLALAIDPNYSKAHGRLGLALTSLDRHTEARAAYARALQLEPDNESYQTNLRVTEEKLASQPNSGGGAAGMDFGTLLQNPALMNMATDMLSDPGMQNLISGLLGGANQNAPGNAGAGGMNALLEAGQMLAQHMQQSNPELVDQLRRQMNPGPQPPNPPPQ